VRSLLLLLQWLEVVEWVREELVQQEDMNSVEKAV
jgi:hypothetical protein